MMGDPWLNIIGMPDDSADALPAASQAALAGAEVIFGGARHLERVGAGARGQAWPLPFSLDPVLAQRGRPVVILASGDPFWFGAGGSIVGHLSADEWRSLPAPSTFSLVANALGWRLEEVTCHGLHAAPLAQLRGVLAPRGRMICLLRDGDGPSELARFLCENGAGAAQLHVAERMGGPDARLRHTAANGFDLMDVMAPVAVAVELPADVGLPRSAGLPDDSFAHDGQITKAPVRALTVSALAPRKGDLLWDIGAGSGSVSVEYCLAGGRAVSFEQHESRAANVRKNCEDFGLAHRMMVLQGRAPEVLMDHPIPDVVFVGGGGNAALYDDLFTRLPVGTRLVANGVTLETEALLAQLHATRGGSLLRIELAQAGPLGNMRGWQSLRPVVQWSVTL
tara:strand:- start:162940 stop:164124 length:1185 start_codon:yes stop_codon:yes gene_type:complete